MDINVNSNKIPLPSNVGKGSIDSEKLKQYSLKDLIWAFKTIHKFKEARDSLLEIIRILAEAGVDASKINWNDPFSIMNAFLTVKGMSLDVDINEIVDKLNSISDISFEDIDRALDIIDTFIKLSSKAEKIAKSVMRRGYTAKEFDMLMGLLGIGNTKSYKIDVEDVSDEKVDEEITDEELDRIREIINKYRSREG